MSYSGAVPMASEAEVWERIAPGAAERFLAAVDEERRHRHELSKDGLEMQSRMHRMDGWSYRLALLLAFLICTGVIYVAYVLAERDHPVQAAIVIGALSTIVLAYLARYSKRRS